MGEARSYPTQSLNKNYNEHGFRKVPKQSVRIPPQERIMFTERRVANKPNRSDPSLNQYMYTHYMGDGTVRWALK